MLFIKASLEERPVGFSASYSAAFFRAEELAMLSSALLPEEDEDLSQRTWALATSGILPTSMSPGAVLPQSVLLKLAAYGGSQSMPKHCMPTAHCPRMPLCRSDARILSVSGSVAGLLAEFRRHWLNQPCNRCSGT